MAIRQPDQRASVGLNSRRGRLEIQVDGRGKHQHDWARTDLVALARSALEAVAGRVGAPAVQEALEACDAAVLGQLGLAASPR